MRNFFVKSGRPSKEEKGLAAKIEALIAEAEQANDAEALKRVDEIGAVYNLDGLKKLYNTLTNKSETMAKGKKDDEDFENPSSSTNEESVEFEETLDNQTESPLQQPVIERVDEISKFQEEHGFGNGEGGSEDGGEDGNEEENEEEEFEEPRAGHGGGGGNGGGGGGGDDDDDNVGGNLGDMPPHTKNKAINSTADVLTKIYAGVLPILPKMLAKVPKKKIDRMKWNDEINIDMKLDMGLDANGRRMVTSVGRYIDDYNDMIDDQMQLDEQQQEDFKKCLKAVLSEKQVAMTPSQQLFAVMTSHLAGFLVMGIQNNITMRRNLEYWRERHEESKSERTGGSGGGGQKPPTKQQPPPPKPDPKPPVDKTPPASNGAGAGHDDTLEENEEISINPEEVKS